MTDTNTDIEISQNYPEETVEEPRIELYGYLSAPTGEEIIESVREKQSNKIDKIVPNSSIVLTFNEETRSMNYRVVRANETYDVQFDYSALTQLLNRMKIPSVFYRRCSTALQHSIFDEFKNSGNSYLFRTYRQPEQDEYYVRAVLSNRYGIIDDHELFPVVVETLNNSDVETSYRSFEWDRHISVINVDFQNTQTQLEDRTYFSGLRIVNSETGYSSVWIEPVVYSSRYLFCNRKTLKTQGVRTRIIHKGEFDPEEVRHSMEQCLEISQVGIIQLENSRHENVHVDHAIEYIKNIDAIPNRFHDLIKEEWQIQEEITKMAVAEKILEIAQQLPLFQRVQVEQHAGNFIGLFDSYQERMDQIFRDLALRQEN